jgi:hypothetical protein
MVYAGLAMMILPFVLLYAAGVREAAKDVGWKQALVGGGVIAGLIVYMGIAGWLIAKGVMS